MKENIIILGINFGGHDTAASIMINGQIIAACEQERYTHDKHSRLFPSNAIKDCLKIANIKMHDVNEIAFGFDPIHSIIETYLKTAVENPERIGFLIADIEKIKERFKMEEHIRQETGFKGLITFHRHHLAHLASTYYPSGFSDALLYSIDGMGEIETTLLGTGKNGNIDIVHSGNRYPHSFGLLYSAITFYLGWKHHCDEGIIMGLASYGNAKAIIPGTKKTYSDIFAEILHETGDYNINIDLDWISYHKTRDTWLSEKFIKLFGPKREPNDPIKQHHKNIAAALQNRLEEIVLNQLRKARTQFNLSKLCLAGGVALNCSLNGAIEASGIFEEIFVQPASGDQGSALGACYLSHVKKIKNTKPRQDYNNLKGSNFTNKEIEKAFKEKEIDAKKPKNIYELTAKKLAEGKIIAWFQDGAEFGPRALGNRSILTRPYPAEMKDYLNMRVKFREEFRPFAPAVLLEHQNSFFDIKQKSPHMLIACKVRPEKRDEIPAVVHVDGSCRVQTVLEDVNPRFRKLLMAFYKETNCPVLLNTSFNVKGQPIINTPQEAINCYLSTNIDFLVIGDWCIEKTSKLL